MALKIVSSGVRVIASPTVTCAATWTRPSLPIVP